MANDSPVESNDEPPEKAAAATGDLQYWCNFCDFRTSDLNAYLSHSCRTVLDNLGVEVLPTGRNECT